MLPALGKRGRAGVDGVVAQKAAEVDIRQNIAERLHGHEGVLIAAYDVFVGVELMRVGRGDKGNAVGRLNGLDLFCDLERRGLYIVGHLRLNKIFSRFEPLYSQSHLRELIARASAVFKAYGRRDGLNIAFLIKLFCHQ